MRKPTIICYFDYLQSSCSFWRGINPLQELAREDHINLVNGEYGADTWVTLRGADIAFFQRPMNKNCFEQMAIAKDLGLKIVVDIDDHNMIDPSHPVYSEWEKFYDEVTFQKMMMLTDVLMVSTQALKDYYLKYNNNVVVVPNALNDAFLKFRYQSNNKIVLLRGGSHHLSDIWEYRNEIIEVMRNHPDWKLVCLGSEVKFLADKLKNYEFGGDFEIHEYFGYILTTRPSIIIVPLIDNELNSGKSNISWLEATLCGGVALTPSYWKLKGKSATYKDRKTFKESFERLITDQMFRNELFFNSSKIVQTKYILSEVNKMRLKIFKSLI